MKKSMIALLILVATAALVVYGAASTSAQDKKQANQPMIQRIAEKFDLKEDDVRAVFSEGRQTKHEYMQQQIEERLSQAVTDGRITETQKGLILDKYKELLEKRSMDFENRQMIDTERQDLEQWAKENGIDMMYVLGGSGFPGKGMGCLYH